MTPRKSTAWAKVSPDEMTNDQLAEALNAVQTRIDEISADLQPLTITLMHLQARVSGRFRINLPGVASPEQMSEYPSEFVAGYDWKSVGTEDSTS